MTSDREALLSRLADSEARLAAAVAALSPQEYAAPSLLPDWTRAHVVAHLVLNAEGLAGAVAAAVGGREQPMYASPDARDGDIADLAAADPALLPDLLPDRLAAAVSALGSALRAVDATAAQKVISRTPGSDRTFLAGSVAEMRWGEVEIHHADLGGSYSPADWPADFTTALLERFASRASGLGFTAYATDLDRTWQCGADTPVVSGLGGDLAWWLTGRGDGAGLTSEGGTLPRTEAW